MAVAYLSVTWKDYHSLALNVAESILSNEKPFDIIIAIGRGGLTFGHLLSDLLNTSISSITIQSYTDIEKQADVKIMTRLSTPIKNKRVLLVDDIADTGKTLTQAHAYLQKFKPKTIIAATLFYKPRSAVKPEYFAKETTAWILQPFESTEWIRTFTASMKKENKSAEDIEIFLKKLGYTHEQIQFVWRNY